MKRIFAMLTALAMLLMSCTAFAATDIGEGQITAEGVGSLSQSASLGYRAARLDAYRNLLEEIKGVQIDSETSVQNSITTNDVINTQISGVVKGAKVIKKFKDADGYHVVLAVPVFGVGSVAEAVIPANPNPAPLPSASSFSTGTSVKGTYTGVIIDCRGLGLSTAMAPAIFTPDGQPVYGSTNFSDSFLIKNGCVGYSNSVDSGVERAGVNPLVIQAVGIQKFVSPVISPEDAGRILAENQATGFLNRASVVFVK